MSLVILLPAAGASARMRGADKLLETLGGTPLLARQAARALETGARVIVTLRPGDTARAAALRPLACARLALVDVPDAAEGMAASLRAGIAALPPGAEAVMILPPDMPDLTTEDLARVIDARAAHPDAILRATSADGRPGHPVIFPARLFPAIAALRGDTGARVILAAESPVSIALPGSHALTDLDTPEDWAAWRETGD